MLKAVVRLAGLAMVLFCWEVVSLSALGQTGPLLPVDDPEAEVPLIPAGISRNTPELYGNYAYLWVLDDQTQVIQYHGDFALHLGDRRLRSQESVVWMQRCRWQEKNYYHYEVYLSQKAQVLDMAGTVTAGPELFVTFNSTEPPVVAADVTDRSSSSGTKLYQEAAKIRQSMQKSVLGVPKAVQTGPPGKEAEVRDEAARTVGEMEVVDLSAPRVPVIPKPRPIVRYRADREVLNQNENLVTATGHVYVSQGLIDSGDFLEIRADAAVLFLAERSAAQPRTTTEPAAAPGLEPFPVEQGPKPVEGAFPGSPEMGIAVGLGAAVAGVYLEGDVVLTRGERMIRGSQLYYDFKNDRALILDAVMRAIAPDRNLPIYVRAAQVRQLSTTEYQATGAVVSSSEFHTPHVHIGADRVHLTDATPRDEGGRISGVQAGRYTAKNVTLNLEGVPIAYWPYAAGDFRESETPIRSVRIGYGDDFGAEFQSKWYLFNLMGTEKPQGVDALLRLDYFSKRGPGVGTDIDYETEDTYGQFRGYYIHDTGEDTLGPIRSGPPDTENRGRITWRHRQLLGRGWELTLEGSHISDPHFLEEYFTGEFEEGKEQETLVYLKKQEDNWAVTGLAQWRILDFLTQTEHLPDLGFHWVGQPLAQILNYYNESHIGFVRYRTDNRRFFDENRVFDNTGSTDITFRTETRNELDLPIKIP
ncbi:MAG TPA: LPS assembly protein LptD, partial [Phycisphaerae bacterium]|nr:LPS assembly protein LptD [Phycisphaerae bacterium]